MPRLDTARLTLLPASLAMLEADLEGPVALERALGVPVPPAWPPELYNADAIRWTIAALSSRPTDRDWCLYYVVRRPLDDAPELLVGLGGFKAPPDGEGMVELGYGILTAHRRRGYATETVLAMCEFALHQPQVRRVIAHTLSHLDASIGVLVKAGFTFVGEGEDPDAPPGSTVVRYELARSA